ncbi:MAG: hypothetical protein IPP01_02370 [Saprospiraceae bacterium]|nr:hypothetical protein [Saprospiraceae bacterium]
MKRRSFLKASSLATVPVLINGIPVEAIAKTTFANFVNPEDDRVFGSNPNERWKRWFKYDSAIGSIC